MSDTRFWSKLDLSYGFDAAELALVRSKNALLDIVCCTSSESDAHRLCNMILPHAARCRLILYEGSASHKFVPLFQNDLPQVHFVDIENTGETPVGFPLHGCPLLRGLRMTKAIPPWEPHIFSNLVNLTLKELTGDCAPPTATVMQILAECSSLKSLELSKLTPPPASLLIHQRAHLPHLHALTLDELTDEMILALLWCIETENLRRLDIYFQDLTSDADTALLKNALRRPKPSNSPLGAVARNLKADFLLVVAKDHYFSVRPNGPEEARGPPACIWSLERTFPLSSTFDFSSVDIPVHVDLGGKDIGYHPHMPRDPDTTFLNSTPTLAKLEIAAQFDPVPIIQRLASMTSLCPGLKEIHVTHHLEEASVDGPFALTKAHLSSRRPDILILYYIHDCSQL